MGMMRQLLRLLSIVLMTIVNNGASAQSSIEFNLKTYDETQGLPSRHVTDMLQDRQGFMWFATADGLSRFDGYGYKTFRNDPFDPQSIRNNNIVRMAEDRNHKLWLGFQRGGLSSFDTETGRFRYFPLRESKSAGNVAPSITLIFVDSKNRHWISMMHRGLFLIDEDGKQLAQYDIVSDSSKRYSPEFRSVYNTVYGMVEDAKGLFWLATHDGLYRFNAGSGKLEAVREKPVVTEGFRDDLFSTILLDDEGLWLGAWGGGLTFYEFAGKKWQHYYYDTTVGPSGTKNIVSSIARKRKDQLWLATYDKGLVLFHTAYGVFTKFDDRFHKGLPNEMSMGVIFDKDDDLWIRHEGGVTMLKMRKKKFRYKNITVSHSDNNQNYEVLDIIDEPHRQFQALALGDGLHILHKETEKTSIIPVEVMKKEEPYMVVTDLLKSKTGTIWVLSRDYLYTLDTLKEKLNRTVDFPKYSDDRPSNYLSQLAEDDAGGLWITTRRNGVFYYQPNSNQYTQYNSSNSALPTNVTSAIAIDARKRIWVGSIRGMLGYFDPVTRVFKRFQEERTYALTTDHHGDIWAGTDRGLEQIRADTNLPATKKIYNAKDGIRSDIAYAVREDGKGRIWCSTLENLCMINPALGQLNSYGKQDGLFKNQPIEKIVSSYNGDMILGAQGGYFVYSPDSLLSRQSAAPLVLSSFRVNDQERFLPRVTGENETVQLRSNENIFSFEFAALDYDRPDKQRYAYMLEGFDKDWIQSGTRRFVSYTNIPGGDYVFKVKSTDLQEDSNRLPMSIALHVQPPFYKRWWFIAGVLFLLAGTLYGFYRFRLEKQRQIILLESRAQILEKEKTKVMYENLVQHLNPHFLFNSLTSLGSLISFDQKLATDFLEQMSKIYRYILKSKDRELVALRDEIQFAETYISLQQTRFEKGLQVDFDIPEDYYGRKIAPVTLQNLIENAIKHNRIDEETPLQIRLFISDDYLVVENNLQKKNFVETSNKQGLKSMISLYAFLSARPMQVIEGEAFFTVKIPLI